MTNFKNERVTYSPLAASNRIGKIISNTLLIYHCLGRQVVLSLNSLLKKQCSLVIGILLVAQKSHTSSSRSTERSNQISK